jgi:creatinine amidohydrolase
MNYSDCTSEEARSFLNNNRIFIPIGSIEQHGPHLPLSVDIDIPVAIVNELVKGSQGAAAPGIIYASRSQPHSGGGPSFPGTISVKGTSLIYYLTDIFKAYVLNGARNIVIINGHYENEPFIFEALEVCREDKLLEKIQVIALSWWSVVSENIIIELFGELFPGWHAEHAGLVETSLMMYLKPELVKSIQVDHGSPPLSGVYIHPIDPHAISNRGVLSQTKGATAEIGEKLFIHICHQLQVLLENTHGMLKLF